jgi:UDP-MurNAc hydroxylase
MELLNFGGATAILEHRGVRILMDPWLDDGIFHGSWVHFPPLRCGIEDVGRLDYIYISHIHEDHCSLGTLEHLDRNATVLIMGRKPNLVADFLERNRLKFKSVRIIEPRSPVTLQPGLVADMVEPDPSDAMAAAIDSALILHWDGHVILNANDCQPHPAMIEYVRSAYGKPDLAMLPYSGGSGYPSCYINLTDPEKRAERDRIRSMRMEAFIEAVHSLDPKRVLPFADQYAIAGSRASLNEFVAHPATPAAVMGPMRRAGLADRLVLVNSGQRFDLETGGLLPQEPYRDYSDQERQEWLDGIGEQYRYDHERFVFAPTVPLERLVRQARARLWAYQSARSVLPDWTLVIDTPESPDVMLLPLADAQVSVVARATPLPSGPYLRVRAPRTLMIMMVLGHVSWNIADAALFIDYERVPNRYDPVVYFLLNLLRV